MSGKKKGPTAGDEASIIVGGVIGAGVGIAAVCVAAPLTVLGAIAAPFIIAKSAGMGSVAGSMTKAVYNSLTDD